MFNGNGSNLSDIAAVTGRGGEDGFFGGRGDAFAAKDRIDEVEKGGTV